MNDFFKIVSFYNFTNIDDNSIIKLRQNIQIYESDDFSGLIILAKEGINGTICGKGKIVKEVLELIKNFINQNDINEKISYSRNQIFKKLKIKIKDEIVTMGIGDIDPSTNSGTYVDPITWNELIKDKDTLIIDTRNYYEVSLGSFKNAINPMTNNFREFPLWIERNIEKYTHNKINKKIAMFCTGGIRCEKATSLLTKKGYNHVYHLKGGILKYFEQMPKEENFYNGECYVFDGRVAVTNQLEKGSYSICYACGMPLSVEDKKKNTFIKGVQCHLCINKFSDNDRKRFTERQKQIDDKDLNEASSQKQSK